MKATFTRFAAMGLTGALLVGGSAGMAIAAGDPSVDALSWTATSGANTRIVGGQVVMTVSASNATAVEGAIFKKSTGGLICGFDVSGSTQVGSVVAGKAAGSGKWTVTLDTKTAADSVSGTWQYCAAVRAKSGSVVGGMQSIAFDVDNNAPAASLTGVTNGASIYKATTVTFTASDINLASMSLVVGSKVYNATEAQLKAGKIATTITPTSDSSLTITGTAKDTAGRTTTKTAAVKTVYSAPTAAVTTAKSPVNKTYTFAGTSARATKVTVAVVRGTKTLIGAKAVTLAANGTWKYALNTKLVTDGTVTLKVVASNPVKTGAATAKSVVVDNTAPKVVAGKVSQAKGKFTLRASWSDANPNKIVAKMYNGSKLVWSGKVLTGKGAKSWAGTWPKTTVKGKTYTVKYTANDKLGQATTKAVKVKRTV